MHGTELAADAHPGTLFLLLLPLPVPTPTPSCMIFQACFPHHLTPDPLLDHICEVSSARQCPDLYIYLWSQPFEIVL